MQGGQVVAINKLQTYVYINLTTTGSSIVVQNITNPLVQAIATTTPGSVVLSVDPSLSTLEDYSLFGYDGTVWKEIPRTNLDAGGSTVALYGNVPGMILRKQSGSQDHRTSMEVSIPVPVTTYGNIMQFVNISSGIFGFTLNSSADTYGANMYIQLIFTASYPTTGTKLSGWVPTYAAGLALWLNASEPGAGTFTPNTGVPMTNWTDKSGRNNHATAVSGTTPMYKSLIGGVGMGMYFNGSSFFTGNMQNTGNYSYTFAVARPDVTSPATGRVLSLSAAGVDDSASKSYMGVTASSGGAIPATKRIVMGLGKAATNKIIYSDDNGTTWTAANSSWSASGSCSSIAYNGYMFVAVGDDGNTNGVIKYSYDGNTWTAANYPTGGLYSPNYGFYTDGTTGGIKVVIFTGSIWICGGKGSNSYVNKSNIPGIAYSYDGINWTVNQSLPFNGTGDCITSIATNGKLIILSGFLTPSMSYSYDGINWSNMPQGAYTATQIATAAVNTGVHSVVWDPNYKLWIAGGDGGNPSGNITSADGYKKVTISSDGFTWSALDSNTQGQLPLSGSYMNITRVFSTYSGVNSPAIICSTPLGSNNSGTSTQNYGPLMSMPQSSSIYGFYFVHASNSSTPLFPVTSGSTNETSAVYWNGTNLMYGLQQSPWFVYNVDRAGFTTPSISLINGPVNAIVDNTNPNPNFKASAVLNGVTTTAANLDANQTKPYIITAWADGMNTCVAINGTLIPTNQLSPALFNMTSYMIGKNNGTSTNNYKGYIYEIINFNMMLYSEARRVVEGYLAWKWALQSLLPATHAFYTAPPTKSSITIAWPRIFSDLKPLLWLDAQDPNANESFAPADKTMIGTWYDKSGNKNNLVAPPGSEPMYRNNAITTGSIQFNRYAFQSIGATPLPLATDTLPTVNRTTPSNWIPGFGGFSWSNGTTSTPTGIAADNYGYLYLGINNIGGNAIQLIQYDENNIQTRMLYYSDTYTIVRSISIGSITGNIYIFAASQTSRGCLIILTPSSLPITANTSYTVNIPKLYKYSGSIVLEGTEICGCIDSSENVYLFGINGAAGAVFRFPLNYYIGGNWVSDFYYPQLLIAGQDYTFYSDIDKSISYYNSSPIGQRGRSVAYLNSSVSFTGQIIGTVLTVYSITSGTIQIGSIVSAVVPMSNTYNNIITDSKIKAQTSGTPGGIGVYTVSISQNSPTINGSCSGTTLTLSGMNNGQYLPLGSILNTAVGGVVLSQISGGALSAGTYTISLPQDIASGQPINIYIPMTCILVTTQIGYSNVSNWGSVNTLDGLLDASKVDPSSGYTSDPVALANTFYSVYIRNVIYDPIGNYMYGTWDPSSASARIKRMNLATRQLTTIVGSVNIPTWSGSGGTQAVSMPITSQKFPIVYETNGIYETVASTPSVMTPFMVGSKAAYFISASNNQNFGQVLKISNPRATSSCMSGPLTLTGTSVSVFIVYLNVNTSKKIMPHETTLKTPVISLSTKSDFAIFTGYIIGTVLTVTAIQSGTIQLGATITTPLGGFLVSYGTASSQTPTGTYNVSIFQNVAPGTTITASNGTNRTQSYSSNNSSGLSFPGAQPGIDTTSSSYISLYTDDATRYIYRNNGIYTPSVPQSSVSAANPPVWPASGVPNTFIGGISGTTLTVTSMSSGVIQIGSVLNVPGSPTVTAWGGTTYGGVGTYTISSSMTVADGTNMTATMPPLTPDIVFFSSSATGTKMTLNGTTVINSSTAQPIPFNISAIGLGIQPGNAARKDSLIPNYFFDGSISEVIVYNTDLSKDTYRLQLMEGYLAWKWGVQKKLPVTHMYKSVAPTDLVSATPSPITSYNVTNITDYSFVISWSGGNNATTYTYNITPTPPSTYALTDNGVKSRTATLSGLAAQTQYTLIIQANSTLSTSSSVPIKIKTRYYSGVLWGGGTSATNPSKDTFTGPATLANFYSGATWNFDKYNNLYVTQYDSANGIRVITPNGIVQSITTDKPISVGGLWGGSMFIDASGKLYVNTANYIYILTPGDFPFKIDSTNRITTVWAVTIFAGTGVAPTQPNKQTGISTTVPIANNCTLLFSDMNSAYIYELNGYIRPVINNGNGTYNLGLGPLVPTYADKVWKDSANVYVILGNDLYIYNIAANSFQHSPTRLFEVTSWVMVDSAGNIYYVKSDGIYRIMMVGVDLNNMNDLNAALSVSTLFLSVSANTSNVTVPSGMPLINKMVFDNNNNLYVICVTDIGGYMSANSIYKFSLTG